MEENQDKDNELAKEEGKDTSEQQQPSDNATAEEKPAEVSDGQDKEVSEPQSQGNEQSQVQELAEQHPDSGEKEREPVAVTKEEEEKPKQDAASKEESAANGSEVQPVAEGQIQSSQKPEELIVQEQLNQVHIEMPKDQSQQEQQVSPQPDIQQQGTKDVNLNQPQQPLSYQVECQEMDEHELIKQACLNRKKENYNLLRLWESKRTQFLNNHAQILNQIQASLDIRGQVSKSFFQLIKEFLQNKVKQESSYSQYQFTSPMQNIQILSKLEHHNNYTSFISVLEKISQSCENQQKKAYQLSSAISQQILSDLLFKHEKEYMEIMDNVRNNIIQLDYTSRECAATCQKKSVKLVQIYEQSIQSVKGSAKSGKDQYLILLSYLRKSIAQNEIQKELGVATMKYWKAMQIYEERRQQVLYNAFQMYISFVKQTYGQLGEADEQLLSQLEKIQKENNIPDSYDPSFILSQNQLAYVKQELSKDKITVDDMSVFCEKFIIQQFDERMLELKSFQGQREIAPNTYIETKVVITADHYLHCFDNYVLQQMKKTYPKPSVSMRLTATIITIMQELIIKISQKKNLFQKFIQQAEDIILKFKHNDEVMTLNKFIKEL